MFANAKRLYGSSGAVTASTVNATSEIGEPFHAGTARFHSAWFSWMPPVSGSVTIDTFGSDFDTVLAVYVGGDISSLTFIAANDDYLYSGPSLVTFTAVAGQQYVIAIDGYHGASGLAALNWTFESNSNAPAGTSAPATTVVTSRTGIDSTASGNSSAPVLSADRGHVAFLSDAPDLTTNPVTRPWLNIYLRDLAGSNTVLVSSATNGSGANGMCGWPSVSAGGDLVAFVSDASNLVPGDSNNAPDVFLRDVVAGTTILVSADVNGRPASNTNSPLAPFSSAKPMISADKRWVIFESSAATLTTAADTNRAIDIFAHDLQENVTVLVTRSTNSEVPSKGSSLCGATPDAHWIVFSTFAAGEIVAGAGNPVGADIVVRSMPDGAAIWASPLSPYFQFGYHCRTAAISDGGDFVLITAAESTSADAPALLFRVDLTGGMANPLLIASNLWTQGSPQMSSTGAFVLYEDGTNVYRWRADTASTELVNVSVEGSAATSGTARNARMTSDGSRIAFLSDSTNLTVHPANGSFQLFARVMNTGTTHLITSTPDSLASSASAEASSFDIRENLVAFDSGAADLAVDDHNHASDVFVHGIETETTALVSERRPASPARSTASGHAQLASTALSSDGRFLAFVSMDSDLTEGDTNHMTDAFLADLANGTTVRVASTIGTNAARAVAISGDGRYVVVARMGSGFADDLLRYDRSNGIAQLLYSGGSRYGDAAAPGISFGGNLICYPPMLVMDANAATNEYASQTAGTPVLSGGRFHDGLFTLDSRFVVYASGSTLYTWDRVARQLQSMPVSSTAVALSGNSRYLLYSSGMVYRRDLVARTDQPLGQSLIDLGISADGRYVVGATATWPRHQVVLIDAQTGQTNLLSVSPTGIPGDGSSRYPVISADGRWVAYVTDAGNIIGRNSSGFRQVVLRDVLIGATTVISTGADGRPGNYHSGTPMLSANGRILAFQSMADNLVSGDYNNRRDIFTVTLSVDSDEDGMDDRWEVAHFGTLARNGSGDADGDGVSDRDEFRAGTDPTNRGSVFSALTMTRPGGSQRQIIWTGDPSRSYQIDYKDDLGAPGWTPLRSNVGWNGSTASAADNSATTKRFYRVVQLP